MPDNRFADGEVEIWVNETADVKVCLSALVWFYMLEFFKFVVSMLEKMKEGRVWVGGVGEEPSDIDRRLFLW